MAEDDYDIVSLDPNETDQNILTKAGVPIKEDTSEIDDFEVVSTDDPSSVLPMIQYKQANLKPLTRYESDLLYDFEEGKTLSQKAGEFGEGVTSGVESAVAAIPKGVVSGVKLAAKNKPFEAASAIQSGLVAEPLEDMATMGVNALTTGTGVTDWAQRKLGIIDEDESRKRFADRIEAKRLQALDKLQRPDRTAALLEDYGLKTEGVKAQQAAQRAELQDVQNVGMAANIVSPINPYVLPGKVLGKIPLTNSLMKAGAGGLRNLTADLIQGGGNRLATLGKWGTEKIGGATEKAAAMAEKMAPGLSNVPIPKLGFVTKVGRGITSGVQKFGEGFESIGRNMTRGLSKEAAERLGKAGPLGEKLAEEAGLSSRKTVFDRIIADQKAPEWMRSVSKAIVNTKLSRVINRADELASHIPSGAAFGAGLGALTADTAKELGESVGFGAGVGVASNLATESPSAIRNRRETGDLARFFAGLNEKDASNILDRIQTTINNAGLTHKDGSAYTKDQLTELGRRMALDVADVTNLGKRLTDVDIRFLNGNDYNARRTELNDGQGQNTAGIMTSETLPTGAKRPVIDINLDSADFVRGSLAHEVLHHLEKLDGMKEYLGDLDKVLFDTTLPGETVPVRTGLYSDKDLMSESSKYIERLRQNEFDTYRRSLIEQLGNNRSADVTDVNALEQEAAVKLGIDVVNQMRRDIFAASNEMDSARAKAAQQGGDALKSYLDRVKSEIRAETVRNVYRKIPHGDFLHSLESKTSKIADRILLGNEFGLLRKARETLVKLGINPRDILKRGASSRPGEQPILGKTATPEAEAAVREFLRAKDGIQDRLSTDSSPEVTTFSAVDIVSNPELTNRYESWDAFERELVEARFDKDGKLVGETVLPKDRQNTAVSGDTIETPDGGKIVVEQRIKRGPSVKNKDGSLSPGTPILRSDREIERMAKDRAKMISDALTEGANDDTSAEVPLEVGTYTTPMVEVEPSKWRGLPSENQMNRIMAIPDKFLPQSMKEKIKTIVEQMKTDYGRRFLMEYQPALGKTGKYSSKLGSTLRDEVPIGFFASKARNFLVTTLSMTSFNSKLERWMSNSRLRQRFEPWNGDATDFFTDVVGLMDHYYNTELRGEDYFTAKGDSPNDAIKKKNIINDFINIKNLESVLQNPDRVEQDRSDNLIRSRRIDRITRLEPIDSDLPRMHVNYGKQLANYMPSDIKGEPIKYNSREEAMNDKRVMWHGSASGDLRGGPTGLHLGSFEAAKDALEATIGTPVEGEWDGTREYGKTLLMGRDSLKKLGEIPSGYRADAPKEDYYPDGKAKYSNGELIPLSVKPELRPFRITGPISNTIYTPHGDWQANGRMRGLLERGRAKSAYFYKNIAEGGPNEISIVTPGKGHLTPVEYPKENPEASFMPSEKFWSSQIMNADGTAFDVDDHLQYLMKKYKFPAKKYLTPEGEQEFNKLVAKDKFAMVTRAPNDIYIRSPQGLTKEQKRSIVDEALEQNKNLWINNKLIEERQPRFDDPRFMPAFYSQLEKTLDEKLPKAAKVSQVLDIIKTGVKEDELKWTGIREFLQDKETVTKQELKDYLNSPEGKVEFKETKLHKNSPYPDERITSFEQYSLPGGDNYREVIIEQALPSAAEYAESKYGTTVIDELTPEQFKDIREHSEPTGGKQFRESHWKHRTPYYVAHMRLKDRTDSNGKPGLFVEEFQSDRHQQGREKGYKQPLTPELEEFHQLVQKTWTSSGEEDQSYKMRLNELKEKNPNIGQELESSLRGIPDAPYRKNWHEMLFKRALNEAIETGKDWIGWTDGKTQNDRYNLSKYVDEISYDPENQILKTEKEGSRPNIINNVTPENLASYVGKDAAHKLLTTESKPEDLGYKILRGKDLEVGGEGMKGFYDKILPEFVNKYVKKWGGKVEKDTLETKKQSKDQIAYGALDGMGKEDADSIAENLIWNENFTEKTAPSNQAILDVMDSMQEFALSYRAAVERGDEISFDKMVKDFKYNVELGKEGPRNSRYVPLNERLGFNKRELNAIIDSIAEDVDLTTSSYKDDPSKLGIVNYWKLPITEVMRKDIAEKGQPLFMPKSEETDPLIAEARQNATGENVHNLENKIAAYKGAKSLGDPDLLEEATKALRKKTQPLSSINMRLSENRKALEDLRLMPRVGKSITDTWVQKKDEYVPNFIRITDQYGNVVYRGSTEGLDRKEFFERFKVLANKGKVSRDIGQQFYPKEPVSPNNLLNWKAVKNNDKTTRAVGQDFWRVSDGDGNHIGMTYAKNAQEAIQLVAKDHHFITEIDEPEIPIKSIDHLRASIQKDPKVQEYVSKYLRSIDSDLRYFAKERNSEEIQPNGDAWMDSDGVVRFMYDFGKMTHNHLSNLPYGGQNGFASISPESILIENALGHAYAPMYNKGFVRIVTDSKSKTVYASSWKDLTRSQKASLEDMADELKYKIKTEKDDKESHLTSYMDEDLEMSWPEIKNLLPKKVVESLLKTAKTAEPRTRESKRVSNIERSRNYQFMPSENLLPKDIVKNKDTGWAVFGFSNTGNPTEFKKFYPYSINNIPNAARSEEKAYKMINDEFEGEDFVIHFVENGKIVQPQ